MSFNTAGRALMLGIAALMLAGTAQAQSPTPEGTVIRNEATATYTDGTTTYTADMAFVEVTVGFKAGVGLPGTDGSQTPASGSTGNEYTFTITNDGNGADSVNVAFTPSSANITITGYRVDGGAVLTLAQLELALSQLALAAAGTVDVTVIYSVAGVVGGSAEAIDITVNSRRTPATTDTHQLDIVPASVAVTPDGGTVSHLPGARTAVYTIVNNSSLTMTYTLAANSSNTAAATAGAITHGAGGTFDAGATTLQLAAGASGTVNLAYTIPASAAVGATSVLQLTATSTGTPSVSNAGTWDLTVTRPLVVMTKQAFRDNGTDEITASDQVSPGEYIKYRITVRNDGNFDATDVTVADNLPTEVTLDALGVVGDAAGWNFTGTTATAVSALLTSLPQGGAGTQRFFWIRVQVK